ncbi:MAG: iron-containing alcohol dehydrogenase [Deltaproteobacteria bacterium]|nr:iron-containing alcohol dehydrogenase [Deltaproteobacteria bacterium]
MDKKARETHLHFEFATPAAIVFGPGAIKDSVSQLAAWGDRALVVSGKTPQRHENFLDQLKTQKLKIQLLCVNGEPSVDSAIDAVEQARHAKCNMVVAIGGGSVMDTGKVIAAMLTNTGDLTEYLEIIGMGRPLQNRSAPFLAIPTTAGTGAEVTRNAVLTSPTHRIKVSLRSPLMLPHLVVVDPELTLSLPPEVTAASGMDALTQLIESFLSKKANPITDGLCREGLACCARSILRTYDDGQDLDARTDMSLASLFSGMALANGGLGAVHGIAGPLGGHIAVPHGVACGRLLSPVFTANFRRLESSGQLNGPLRRFEEIARMLTGNFSTEIAEGVAWMDRLCERLHIPSLSDFGLEESDLPVIAAQALKASSMRGNPVNLDQADLMAILKQVLV